MRNGEAANSPEVMSDLHRSVAAPCRPAIRLGKTAVKHRRQSLHSAADVAALRDCLEQSTTELRCGLLPDTLTTHTAEHDGESALSCRLAVDTARCVGRGAERCCAVVLASARVGW